MFKERKKEAKIIEEKIVEQRKQQKDKQRKNNIKSVGKKKSLWKLFDMKSIPGTSQKTVPFKDILNNGMIEVDDGYYAMIFKVSNINYILSRQEDQQAIYDHYCKFLNSLDPNLKFQVYLHNMAIDTKVLSDSLIPKYGDNVEVDMLKEEYYDILLSAIEKSKDKTSQKEIFFVFAVEEANPVKADMELSKLLPDLKTHFKKIGCDVELLSAEEIIEFFYGFYNGENMELGLSPVDMIRKGVSLKDAICPISFRFEPRHYYMGDLVGRTIFIRELPNVLTDGFLYEIQDNPFSMQISIHMEPFETADAISFLKKKSTALNSNKIERIQKSAKTTGSAQAAFIPFDLQAAIDETDEIMKSLIESDKKMFFSTIIINITAPSLDELDRITDVILRICRKHVVKADVLTYQQEDGLCSVLPIAKNKIKAKRGLLTDGAGILMPFSSQEVFHKGGFYYGANSASGGLVVFNRKMLQNASGFILGMPGSGKSFSAKQEIISALFYTNDDITIIDPEGEYTPLVKALGGTVINISSSSSHRINPMDMNIHYADDDNPLNLKSEFILSLIELIKGSALLPAEKTIIDRCVKKIYKGYIINDYNEEYLPSLIDLYKELLEQPEKEAKDIALMLEIYTVGSLNMFSDKTNIEMKNRLTAFNTRDLGKQMKGLGLLIVLDCIWNRVCQNRDKGKYTWIYTDEIYLLFANEYSAQFYYELYKRARKWGGIPTGITQNVEDLLKSDTARTMLSNSQFLLLLNQSSSDRKEIQSLLQISDVQLSYITNSDSGSGLLVSGKTVIPITNKFPKKTRLYKIMTTKIDEITV